MSPRRKPGGSPPKSWPPHRPGSTGNRSTKAPVSPATVPVLPALSNAEVKAAVDYIVAQSK